MTESGDKLGDSSEQNGNDLSVPASSRIPLRMIIVMLGLFVLCGVLLFPFPMSSFAWNAAFDLAHAPSFFFAVVAFALLLDPTLVLSNSNTAPVVRLSPERVVLLALIVVVVGAGCEIAQASIGRSPSLSDALANCAGAVAACLLLSSIRVSRFKWRAILIPGGLVLLLMPSVNPIQELREAYLQQQQFPLIASFERARELRGWESSTARLTQTSEWASDGSHSLKIQSMNNSRLMNALMIWPPKNWTGFDALQLTLRNPQSFDIRVSVNVGDRQHTEAGFEPQDRFRRDFLVGPNSELIIRIPKVDVQSAPVGRNADLTQIALVNVVLEKKNDLIFFLDGVQLVNSAEN
jgi:hypothetical protein